MFDVDKLKKSNKNNDLYNFEGHFWGCLPTGGGNFLLLFGALYPPRVGALYPGPFAVYFARGMRTSSLSMAGTKAGFFSKAAT